MTGVFSLESFGIQLEEGTIPYLLLIFSTLILAGYLLIIIDDNVWVQNEQTIGSTGNAPEILALNSDNDGVPYDQFLRWLESALDSIHTASSLLYTHLLCCMDRTLDSVYRASLVVKILMAQYIASILKVMLDGFNQAEKGFRDQLDDLLQRRKNEKMLKERLSEHASDSDSDADASSASTDSDSEDEDIAENSNPEPTSVQKEPLELGKSSPLECIVAASTDNDINEQEEKFTDNAPIYVGIVADEDEDFG